MGLEPGSLVSKQVRLVRVLKSGGMGSVWVAEHEGLHTQVAVKVIQGNHEKKPELAERFHREASAAARIKSPHVVQIHDHGVTDKGDPYMIMELIEGEDLSSRIKRGGPMRLEDVGKVLQQMARVLTKAHALGIVHRDIKPSNIFLVEVEGDIFIKLLDFGVAKIQGKDSEELTTTGEMIGTMVYMSPEQLLDARNVDFRADLWSLAVVAYRAITMELPFNDVDGVGALILELDRASFPPPSKYRKNLPPALGDWFNRAFQRQPKDRFQSARELANEFMVAIDASDRASILTTSSDALPRVTPPIADPTRETTPDLSQNISGTRVGLGAPVPSSKPPSSRPPQASAAAPSGVAAGDDPVTSGGAPLTFSGGKRESRTNRRSTLRNVVLVVLSFVSIGVLVLALMKRGGAPAQSTPPDPRTSASSPAASVGLEHAPAPTAAPTTAPVVSVAATPSATPTAAPSGSARVGPKGRLPPGQRPPNTGEKDYGF